MAHVKLEYLVQAELSPLEAIESGTRHAAEAMGRMLYEPATSSAHSLLEGFYPLLLVDLGTLLIMRRLV